MIYAVNMTVDAVIWEFRSNLVILYGFQLIVHSHNSSNMELIKKSTDQYSSF
jgi:hypothetical protein